MKKWGFFTALLLLSLLISACRGKEQLLCTVTEVYDNAVMAVCEAESASFSEGDKVYVSCETMPELQPGDAILVTFGGDVMLSEPAQIVADKIELE